ncbi:MAG: hypothetical protein HYY65_04900 [Candidatus Tectomicrobia bacterium]|uniref:Uncharacterized protein n=1 Tax=Tectimicrobiota bacterium TaxID=2528274 RepID=A0A932M108_UNCTE|nr:hypothetical protein [Candidatus Tectomicrobia bacterium]
MTDWYEQSVAALPLDGFGARTEQCYTHAVNMLFDFCGQSPALSCAPSRRKGCRR